MKKNLILLTEEELDKPIYRIFSFQRLEEIFQTKELTLVKPKFWDDPFENFILNSTGKLPNGHEFQIEFRNNFYGQCWSLLRESDAMWRIYSPEKKGVKVKTTIRKLFTSFYKVGIQKENERSYNHSSFIGKVQYQKTSLLIDMLKDEKRMSGKIFDNTGWGQASTFFFKRIAFRHEKEIRLIYNSHGHNHSNIFKFNINPNDLFDQIVFDPRMTEEFYTELKSKLESYGYNKKLIIQSRLYKLRTFTILLNKNADKNL